MQLLTIPAAGQADQWLTDAAIGGGQISVMILAMKEVFAKPDTDPKEVLDVLKWVKRQQAFRAQLGVTAVKNAVDELHDAANAAVRSRRPAEELEEESVQASLRVAAESLNLVDSIATNYGAAKKPDPSDLYKVRKEACITGDQGKHFLHALFLLFTFPWTSPDYITFLRQNVAHARARSSRTVENRFIILTTPGLDGDLSPAWNRLIGRIKKRQWADLIQLDNEAKSVLAYAASLYFCCCGNTFPLTIGEMVVFLIKPKMHYSMTLDEVRAAARNVVGDGTITSLAVMHKNLGSRETFPQGMNGSELRSVAEWPALVRDATTAATHAMVSEVATAPHPLHGSDLMSRNGSERDRRSNAGRSTRSTASSSVFPGALFELMESLKNVTEPGKRQAEYAKLGEEERKALGNGICSYCGHRYGKEHVRVHRDDRECPAYKPHKMATENCGTDVLRYPVYVRLGWATPQPETEKKKP